MRYRLRSTMRFPTISSLSPSSAVAGSAAFTLTVNGVGFVNGATVNFQWRAQGNDIRKQYANYRGNLGFGHRNHGNGKRNRD